MVMLPILLAKCNSSEACLVCEGCAEFSLSDIFKHSDWLIVEQIAGQPANVLALERDSKTAYFAW
jgi:hypothetical protein